MAGTIFRLHVSVATATVTAPADTRFFYLTTAETAAGSTLTIDAAAFKDDTDASVVTLPSLSASNSYFNVYLNGVLLEESICTYTPGATGVGSLAIAVPAGGDPIYINTPVVVEVMNFVPVSTNTVTT